MQIRHPTPYEPPRVLIVEPHRTNLGVMARRLAEHGFRVTTADTGEAAIAELYRLPVELVLAELDMPRMSGAELARAIRGEVQWNDIPVMLITGRSDPKGAVNPHTIQLLDHLGYDTSVYRSKSWDEFILPGAPQFDFIFTVCDNAANEVCPAWPGKPMTAHWGLPDPAAATGDDVEIARAFRNAYAALERRIELFAALPFKSLDRMSLKHRLDQIGARQDAD